MNKTIDDVMICPKCKSDNTYGYSTDEIEFEGNGEGHYDVDCCCINCDTRFRLCMSFKYTVTDVYVR